MIEAHNQMHVFASMVPDLCSMLHNAGMPLGPSVEFHFIQLKQQVF